MSGRDRGESGAWRQRLRKRRPIGAGGLEKSRAGLGPLGRGGGERKGTCDSVRARWE